MSRHLLEVSYLGTNYSGFQIQLNTPKTIQGEVQKALQTIFPKEKIVLTGSSRTDKGVHAKQNFFHFDSSRNFDFQNVLQLNSILPKDIAIKNHQKISDDFHARFSAISREYFYKIHFSKDSFQNSTSYFFPYTLDKNLLVKSAKIISEQKDFNAFCKKGGQTLTTFCEIKTSTWFFEKSSISYLIEGNRFLRGMVRALVATMLLVGRINITLDNFKSIFYQKNCSHLVVSNAPACGLVLNRVTYPNDLAPKYDKKKARF